MNTAIVNLRTKQLVDFFREEHEFGGLNEDYEAVKTALSKDKVKSNLPKILSEALRQRKIARFKLIAEQRVTLLEAKRLAGAAGESEVEAEIQKEIDGIGMG